MNLLMESPIPEEYVKTVDTLSQRGLNWFLIAGLCGMILLVVFLGRRILKDSENIRKEFRELNAKYVEMLRDNASIQEKSALTVQTMANQVAIALDNSNRAIANNTLALGDSATSINQLSKHSNDQVRAFYDMEQTLLRLLVKKGSPESTQ
jgi:hypothetical protein